MPVLILVRGLPGSGKTTYAKANFANNGFKHFETDMFFENDGVFRYEAGNAQKAVNWCQKKTLEAFINQDDIVVSNHFTRHWEMGFYLNQAEKYSYEVIVHTCLELFGASSLYPQKLLDYMKITFED